MASLDDYAVQVEQEQKAGPTITEGPAEPEVEVVQRPRIDFSFLMKETGEGPIEDYVNHPMNPNQSKGLAQVIRGFTGILGSLRFAVLDIVLGFMNMSRERKVSTPAPMPPAAAETPPAVQYQPVQIIRS